MKILQSLLKKIRTPSFMGFSGAAGTYLLGGMFIFGVVGESTVPLRQEGNHSITLRLASIDNGGNQTHFVQEATPPTPPTPPKKKKKQPPKVPPKSKAPVNKVQESPPSKQSVTSNVDQEGGTSQTLRHNEGVSDEFLSKIHSAISANNPYPRMARMRKMQGEVVLEFILNVDGGLEEVRVLSSTAGESLNRSAIKAVYQASKDFPTPPKRVKIKVPITYSLDA